MNKFKIGDKVVWLDRFDGWRKIGTITLITFAERPEDNIYDIEWDDDNVGWGKRWEWSKITI